MPHELCQQLPLEDKENDATYDTVMKRSTMYLLINPKRLVIMDIGHWNAAQTDTRMGKRTTVEVKMKQDVENCMRSKATANINAYQILLNSLVIAVASIVKHSKIVMYGRGTCIPRFVPKGKGMWQMVYRKGNRMAEGSGKGPGVYNVGIGELWKQEPDPWMKELAS